MHLTNLAFPIAVSAIFFVCETSIAQNLAIEKTWTGLNGKSFRGIYQKISEDRAKVDIMTPEGKLLTVGFDNLVLADRDYILARGAQKAAPETHPSFTKPTPDQNQASVKHLSESKGPAWVYPRLELPAADPVPFLHIWKLKDGRVLQGTADARKDSSVILKNTKGVKVTLPETDLVDEDLVRFKLWEATSAPVSLPRLELTYRLTTSKRGSFEVSITTDGNFGRVEFSNEHSTLIYDMADGAFLWTIYYPKKDGTLGPGQKQWGRFEQEYLLPYETKPDSTDLICREFLKKGVERATNGKFKGFPARFMTYPFPAWQETVHDLKLDYVVIDSLTPLAGLYHFLSAPPPGNNVSHSIFHHKQDISCHSDFRQHMQLLGRSRMLPIRMTWTNTFQGTGNTEAVKITQGSFSIELVSASIPASYPAGHFDIPAAARDMPPGSLSDNQ